MRTRTRVDHPAQLRTQKLKSQPSYMSIDLSFARQHKQMDLQENRLNVQILRVHTIEKQRVVADLWAMGQEQLCEYFTKYSVFPQEYMTAQDLLDAPNLKLIKSEGKIYFGQIEAKKREGLGINVYRDGKLYQGLFKGNEKQGYGVEIYPNGNLFMGEFVNNKKHGRGQFFWFNLSRDPKQDQHVEYYEGNWWGGLPDGRGTHQKANGDMYTGVFKNGLKHGEGIQFFGNGDYYKGEYINGLPEGYGEYIWQDGSYYKGDFKQGLRNGYGVWLAGNEKQENYKGHYVMDRKAGYGVYEWENGWIYKGHFDHDFRNGFGELYEGPELVYKGFWEEGQQTEREVKNSYERSRASSEVHNGNRHRYSNIVENIEKQNMNSKYESNGRQSKYEGQKRTGSGHPQGYTSKSTPKRQQFGEFGIMDSIGDYMTVRPQSYSSVIRTRHNATHKNKHSLVGTSVSRPLQASNLYVAGSLRRN